MTEAKHVKGVSPDASVLQQGHIPFDNLWPHKKCYQVHWLLKRHMYLLGTAKRSFPEQSTWLESCFSLTFKLSWLIISLDQ